MILYLHGFLSSEFSTKGQWVKQAFAKQSIEVITPTYPIGSPKQTVEKIEQVILEHQVQNKTFKMVMGSSMGGFYALYFAQKYQWPCIMINPAIDPKALLTAHLGDYEHPTTRERIHLNTDYIEALTPYYAQINQVPETLLLLDQEDEVIPYEIAKTAFSEKGITQIYEKGSHAFEHLEQAWPSILDFYEKKTGC